MIGERLKQLRIMSGKTPTEVSRDTGITRATVYRWEQGSGVPRLAELIIMAEYYGVSLDYIVFGR